MKPRTIEMKKELMDQVEAMRAQGYNLEKSTKKVKMSLGSYYKYKKQLKERSFDPESTESEPPQVVIHEVTEAVASKKYKTRKTSSENVLLIYAPLNQVSEIIRELR